MRRGRRADGAGWWLTTDLAVRPWWMLALPHLTVPLARHRVAVDGGTTASIPPRLSLRWWYRSEQPICCYDSWSATAEPGLSYPRGRSRCPRLLRHLGGFHAMRSGQADVPQFYFWDPYYSPDANTARVSRTCVPPWTSRNYGDRVLQRAMRWTSAGRVCLHRPVGCIAAARRRDVLVSERW
jgi:hypothetical protein